MKLLSFGGQNFMGYNQLNIKMHQLDPLTLVMGYNFDFPEPSANGAGKSALAEHVCYALFGKTLRRLEVAHGKDAVIHEGAKGCSVWADVEIPDGVLHIERYRKHPKLE